MSSNTNIVEFRRKMKRAKMGVWRKNKERKFGSTQPNLPMTKPTANEKAQQKAALKAKV